MNDFAIRVENLGKEYRIGGASGGYKTLRESISGLARRKKRGRDESFWALKDVSFEVKRGEVVGVIGRNGAGKSTLLKVLSRITEPTTGSVRIRGRVGSLLEVGTGFHPELSGRENIFLNGAILGMSRSVIERRFDEIVNFAEVEKFIDTPVKRYSSGMYLKLAFAVASHMEPEILVVDEVLAVGDAQFQKKCLGKMSDVAQQGRTVLFVSHNMAAVQRLCTRGLYLDVGRVRADGLVGTVLDDYQRAITTTSQRDKAILVNNGDVRIVGWQLLNSATRSAHSCYSRELCHLVFRVHARREVQDVTVGFALWDLEGRLILAGTSEDGDGTSVFVQDGMYDLSVKVRLPIKAGLYRLDVSLNSAQLGQFERWTGEPFLNVLPQSGTRLPEAWHGLVNEATKFDFQAVAGVSDLDASGEKQ